MSTRIYGEGRGEGTDWPRVGCMQINEANVVIHSPPGRAEFYQHYRQQGRIGRKPYSLLTVHAGYLPTNRVGADVRRRRCGSVSEGGRNSAVHVRPKEADRRHSGRFIQA